MTHGQRLHERICAALDLEPTHGSRQEVARRLGLQKTNYTRMLQSDDLPAPRLLRGLLQLRCRITLLPDGQVLLEASDEHSTASEQNLHEQICAALGLEPTHGSRQEVARRLGLQKTNYTRMLQRVGLPSPRLMRGLLQLGCGWVFDRDQVWLLPAQT